MPNRSKGSISREQRALISELRRCAGLSIREFAKELGMASGYVGAIETGRKAPSDRYQRRALAVFERHGVFGRVLFGKD